MSCLGGQKPSATTYMWLPLTALWLTWSAAHWCKVIKIDCTILYRCKVDFAVNTNNHNKSADKIKRRRGVGLKRAYACLWNFFIYLCKPLHISTPITMYGKSPAKQYITLQAVDLCTDVQIRMLMFKGAGNNNYYLSDYSTITQNGRQAS